MPLQCDYNEIKAYEVNRNGFLKLWFKAGRANYPMTYLNEDGTTRKEIITKKALFNPDSINSSIGQPITLNHPPEAVYGGNWKQYTKGATLQEYLEDNDDLILAAIIYDSELRDKILSNQYKYVSSGYFPKKELNSDGMYLQLFRDYNHFSILSEENQPRAGEESRVLLNVDSVPSFEDELPKQETKRKFFDFGLNKIILTHDSVIDTPTEDKPSIENKPSTEDEPTKSEDEPNIEDKPNTEDKPITEEKTPTDHPVDDKNNTESSSIVDTSENQPNTDAMDKDLFKKLVKLHIQYDSVLTEHGKTIDEESDDINQLRRDILSCYYPETEVNKISDAQLDGFFLNFELNKKMIVDSLGKSGNTKESKNKASQEKINQDAIENAMQEYINKLSGKAAAA